MNKRTLFLLFFLQCCIAIQLSAQDITVYRAPGGIWISTVRSAFPGAQVQRKTQGREWETIGTFAAPRNATQFIAAYHAVSLAAPPSETVPDEYLSEIWKRYASVRAIDSLGFYREHLQVLAAAGAAYFDAEAVKGVDYEYRIAANGILSKNSTAISYPAPPDQSTKVRPHLIQPTREGVYIEFEIDNPGAMQTAHIYRSYYLRSNAGRIHPLVTYNKIGDKLYAAFTDYTATPKVPYTYSLVPVDAAGNEGKSSEPAILFHVPSQTIQPSVRHLQAVSDERKRAIHLSWLRPSSADIVSVEIFRGMEYSGAYTRIASLSPLDSTFDDFDVEPITTYYYTVALNGSYEQSVNTPRVPGILRATDPNLAAPRDVQLKLEGNVVVVSWDTASELCRGFFVYRGEGYNGTMQKITPLILNNGIFEYRDTLPGSAVPRIYSYALSDENTSYNESPLSPRVSVQTGTTQLPVPEDLAVLATEDGNGVQVLWPDVRGRAPIDGYVLYRRETDEQGRLLSAKEIRLINSYYLDNDVQPVKMYSYSIAVTSGTATGSPSVIHRYMKRVETPLTVSDILATEQDGTVALSWVLPLGMPVKKVYLLRGTAGKVPEQIAALDTSEISYIDSKVKRGERYYYSFVTEAENGALSEATSPLSIRVKETE